VRKQNHAEHKTTRSGKTTTMTTVPGGRLSRKLFSPPEASAETPPPSVGVGAGARGVVSKIARSDAFHLICNIAAVLIVVCARVVPMDVLTRTASELEASAQP